MVPQEFDFLRGPAPLRADCDSNWYGAVKLVTHDRWSIRPLPKHDETVCGDKTEGITKRARGSDIGQDTAAALFTGLARNPLPARETVRGAAFVQVHDDPLCTERHNPDDAEFRRFLDDKIEVIVTQKRLQQRNRWGRKRPGGLGASDNSERSVRLHGLQLGNEVDPATVKEDDRVSGTQPEYACKL